MAKRARASIGLEAPMRAAATAHQGASVTARDVAGWMPRRMSVDAEILPEQNELIARSRDIDRNNGVAKGGLQTIVDNVIGTGLRLSARPDYIALGKDKAWADGFRRQVQSLFHGWYWSTACHAGDSLTGDQISQQQLRAVLLNGEAIALPLWIADRGDGWATKLQTVESDRLSQPSGRPQTRQFRGGIEFDAFGAPVAYHIRRGHPGDAFAGGLFGADSIADWERIPRRTEFGRLRVIHTFDSDRSGQSRGKPLLSAVLPQFKNLDRYTQAELQAAVVNALIAMTIETPLDQESILELFSKDSEAYMKARAEHATRLESGLMLPLFPGDKAQPFIPARPATAFGSFVTNIYRLIGVALDLPYELLLKDFSQTNYSSARAALLEAWRSFNRRRDWFGTTWMDPLYALWFEEAVGAGRIDGVTLGAFYANRHAYLRCIWRGPGRGWIDPVKEAQAAQIRVDANLSTLEDECAEQGKDWEEVLDQRATELARMRELGIDAKRTSAAAPDLPPVDGEVSDQVEDDAEDAAPSSQ